MSCDCSRRDELIFRKGQDRKRVAGRPDHDRESREQSPEGPAAGRALTRERRASAPRPLRPSHERKQHSPAQHGEPSD